MQAVESFCKQLDGSVVGGDGHFGYAARRRNLACRPPALGRFHGADESLPHDGD
jgi:hypothetical protein